jgi:hypothetical protein
MKIDRALFLRLVPVVAAGSACNSSPPAPPPIVAQPAPPVSASAAPSSAASTSTPIAAPSASSASSAGLASGGDAGAAAAADTSAPLTKHACGHLKCPLGAPFREAFSILKHDCKAVEQNFRPEAFQRVMACMMAHNDSRDTCDLSLWGTDPGHCLEGWHKGNVDPATETACRRVTAACKKSGNGALSMSDCQGMLSATAARGERKMIACMTEYCDHAPKVCYMAFD